MLLIAALLLSRCGDENVVFEENVEIPNAHWASKEKAILTTEITDTISQNNLNSPKIPWASSSQIKPVAGLEKEADTSARVATRPIQ